MNPRNAPSRRLCSSTIPLPLHETLAHVTSLRPTFAVSTFASEKCCEGIHPRRCRAHRAGCRLASHPRSAPLSIHG